MAIATREIVGRGGGGGGGGVVLIKSLKEGLFEFNHTEKIFSSIKGKKKHPVMYL